MMKRLTLQPGLVRVSIPPLIWMEISLQTIAHLFTTRNLVVITAYTKMNLGLALYITILIMAGDQLPVKEIQQQKNVNSALQTRIGRKLAMVPVVKKTRHQIQQQ